MALRVFLSATFSDLRDERLEVLEVFRRFRTVEQMDIDLITMEDFGFSELAPIDKCLEQLDKADAYLGIIGFRYGSLAPGGRLSYTEREYRYAHKRKLPIFMLQKEGAVRDDQIEIDPDKLRRLNSFRTHANAKHLVLRYGTRSELGKALTLYLPKNLPKDRLAPAARSTATAMVPFFQQRTRPLLLTADRIDIRTLDVLAWTSVGFLRDRSLIEAYLKRKCRIRILNIKRNGLAAALLAKATGKADLDEDLVTSIRRVQRFERVTELQGGSIELREIDWLPSSTLFIANASEVNATGWVGSYTPEPTTPGGDKWVTELTTDNRAALAFYAAQFEQLWRGAHVCRIRSDQNINGRKRAEPPVDPSLTPIRLRRRNSGTKSSPPARENP